jgi:hypothetical protein
MNRKVAVGLAIFFAIVGIALMGGGQAAVAGLGCHGCAGVAACGGGDDAGACGGVRCFGRLRCHGEREAVACHGRVRCHGLDRAERRAQRCCGVKVECGCGGEAAPAAAPTPAPPKEEKVPEAPKAKSASLDRAPMSFYQVSFRR